MGGALAAAEKQPSAKSRGQFLRVSMNYPNFRLDMEAEPSHQSLAEVRRIVEACAPEEAGTTSLEEASLYELKSRLSDEFFSHPDLIARVKSSLVLDEEVRIVKRVIPFEREFDFESGKQTQQMNVVGVKGRISAMFDWPGTVRECLVHIRGEIPREQQCSIMDVVKQRLGVEVQPRFFFTGKNLEGNVLVEAVCFGENIAERW